MNKRHSYSTSLHWTGNRGSGTDHYRNYERSHTIQIAQKPDILGSSDPAFRGDPTRHNPEELLLASLSACHMLWYLHLCADAGVVVLEYTDQATGIMEETADGGGRFTEVTLNPVVKVLLADMIEEAISLHQVAHKMCFIANSVNFPVKHVLDVSDAGHV